MSRTRQSPRVSANVSGMARAIFSDDPTDFDRLSPYMQEYWERIAVRAVVHMNRLRKAEAEMAEQIAAEEAAAA